VAAPHALVVHQPPHAPQPLAEDHCARFLLPIAEQVRFAHEVQLEAVDIVASEGLEDEVAVHLAHLGMGVVQGPRVVPARIAEQLRTPPERAVEGVVEVVVVVHVIHPQRDPRRDAPLAAERSHSRRVVHPLPIQFHHGVHHVPIARHAACGKAAEVGLIIRTRGIVAVPEALPDLALVVGLPGIGVDH